MRSLAVCALLSTLAAVARAEPPGKRSPAPEDILPQSEFDDPIGVDSDSRTLDSAAPPPQKPPSSRELARERERFGPEPPPTAARAGEVLTAAPAVREHAHDVDVELAPGFARVRVAMRFESRGDKPSELRYRLAIPDGARLAALEVCNASGCRQGAPDGRDGARAYAASLLARGPAGARALPIARGREVRDTRGAAIVVNAAPVREAQPLELRVSYLVPVELHGGVVRLRLPARGMDPQVAATELRLTAPGLIDARVAGSPAEGQPAASVEPWSDVELSARARSGAPLQIDVRQFACDGGARRCGFAQAWAGPRPSAPVDLVIALDVSPSTEGEARGRLLPAIAGLLAVLPEGSRVRALAFAGRAQPLVAEPLEPSRVALAPFDRAIAQGGLGSATRFEAAWELIAKWFGSRAQRRLRPLVAIVGDGGLTGGDARPFERARAARVEVSAINTADRATPGPMRAGVARASGIAVHAAAEAEAAARGRDPGALHDKLRALFAPALAQSVAAFPGGARVELGALRAGEQRAWRGLLRGGLRLQVGARSSAGRPADRALQPALAADALAESGRMPSNALVAIDGRDAATAEQGWPERAARGACDRRGPARRLSGISSDAQPVAPAEEHVCRPADKAPATSSTAAPGRGMPADPLLSMLRQRILPIARGCFRRDRAGRAEYQKRAVFAFILAEREVVEARVEGAIPAALKACLMAAVDTLEVPRFNGTVRVRYPLVTESVPLPDQIELQSGTAGEIDRLFGSAPGR
jgi:hypothetical protein